MLDFAAEEYHPRWGARTSNSVRSVKDRLGGFNSCLFRQIPYLQCPVAPFSAVRYSSGSCSQARDSSLLPLFSHAAIALYVMTFLLGGEVIR
jgi:hypothetical protein